ncbi:hypothetical protein FQA39_LY10396 [Lamprigera yunnana]|nr:hypothetical protein FQA39_LY10396 [Lamprigera yunnana]
MAAEPEHVGDCPDEMESVDDEEITDNVAQRILKYPEVLAALQQSHHSEMLANLPPAVKRRIKALKKLQLETTHIEAKFYDEVHMLECKYNKLYSPLFQKRTTIICGEYEPNDEECQWVSDEDEELCKDVKDKVKVEDKKEEEPVKEEAPTKGIPDFWLTVFRNVGLLAEMVQDHDEPILKHLVDIKVNFVESPMGFVLEFHFEPNEYFTNTVLTKEYDMKCVPDEEDPFGFEGPEIYKCRGCVINWNKGKNVTLKTVKKKQKHKSRGLVRTVTKTVQNDSFFNFFTPAAIPDDINGSEVDDETRNLLTSDFEIGHYIRERIVPRAVLYYTGEVLEEEEDYEEEEDDEEEEEEDSDGKGVVVKPADQNCIPHLAKVTLFNIDSNRSIDMTSISGSTVHFHSSFFEDKRIPPLGNTSFNVVFLGREEGAIESNLFIHTTDGHFKYQVKGASISSPYRLRPIVGVKLPLNTTFSPLINMYNPYTEPIQIMEIYSSGGDFHLELPSGELEGPKNMWEIPPLQSKAVIRVRFHARTEQNHTAYVRIKLNNTEEILVVPLEVEVTSNAGLYAPQGSIDFGVGGSLDSPKQFDLFIHNPLKKATRIHSVSTTSSAIKINYENVKVPSDVRNSKGTPTPTKIATLTIDWKLAYESKDFSGKIIVRYKNGKSKTEIPYYVTVLQGGLVFNSSATTYFINEPPKHVISRDVIVKNDFLIPLALTNVSLPLEAHKFFNILSFKPVILQPQEELTIFTLNLKNNAALSNLKLNSCILLTTNISTVELPLLSYNGKLQLTFPYISSDNSLDLGLLSVDTEKFTRFLVLNTNPVPVNLNKLSSSLPTSLMEIVGCNRGNHSVALLSSLLKNTTKCTTLEPSEYAIIQLTIHSPHSEGQVWGDIVVETQYEKLSIPIHYKVAQGKLEIGPDRLVFDQCFPGKICSHPLRVHSTFNDPMVIENILSIPPDARLSSKHLGHIMARSTKVIGHLYLDPAVGCLNECYSGLNSEDTERWLQTLSLPNTTPDFDLGLVNVLYNRYLNQTSNGLKRWQNLTVRLDTSEVKWHLFKTRVKMSWPSLVFQDQISNGSIFKFPLTQVGNVSYYNITVRNPSSHNLITQLVLNFAYPGFNTLNDGLPPAFIPGYTNHEIYDSFGPFFFAGDYTKDIQNFKLETNLNVHEDTLPILLAPGDNYTFTIGFRAENSIVNSAFLYVRNNLTVMEVIQLVGQGAIPNFKFGNRKPGSSQPLSFELTDKYLKDCEHKKNPFPYLTVKRTFTARNLGEITIFVAKFFINNLPCEGYGFKVLNCDPFMLLPNTTKKIEIAFTPDFTLAKVIRTLNLETSLKLAVNYTLLTTVPPAYLLPCSMVLIRPVWEHYLYYMTITTMCLLSLFVIAMIIIEAEHTLKEAVVFVRRTISTTQPTLDLRLVGAQTRNEIHTVRNEDMLHKEKPQQEMISEEDIIDLMDNNNKPFKETEKYTVLIPTTGKSKKKLSKKNSNELSPPDVQKKCCKNKCSEKNTSLESDNLKKHNDSSEKHKKQSFVKKSPGVEEETSSTTTESSNNEEGDKEISKNVGKKSPIIKTSIAKTPLLNEVCKDIFKVEYKRTAKKVVSKSKEKEVPELYKPDVKVSADHKARIPKALVKERKDRLPLMKKLSVERKSENSSANVRISPTMQFSSSVWGENRATFSDVVARNENTSTSRLPLLHTPNTSNKPTMYVEPYKQSTTDLGPIGSRKTDHQQENHHRGMNDQQFNELSNSFFSDSPNLALENSNTFLNYGDHWEQRTSASQLLSLMHSNVGCSSNAGSMSDPWNYQNTSNMGFWDTTHPRSIANENTPSQVNPSSSYLWGSSSVWQPWAPEIPRTPTRTPPGFASNRELEEHIQHNQSYDLFGMTNIWAQQYPNPWNYPQGQ